MKKFYFIFILYFFSASISAQESVFTSAIYDSYDVFKESALSKRRIKHAQLQPLLEELKNNPLFTIRTVGTSIEGRSLQLVSLGKGNIDVFLWSQMHGDEPTATQAIFDLINFFKGDDFKKEKRLLLKKLRIHFLPMLNPDGAEVYTRRNALGIDMNRDALRLQSPEAQTLKRVRDSLEADFGFNLHDQSTYYNAEKTSKPATISYLAPAYNYEKEVNNVRANAMKVIGYMNRILQQYAPGQVGKYNDDFEPRAFGDNIQKWGTSAILIESGGYQNDAEKQEIRKLNYVSILSALYAIATDDFKKVPLSEYEAIPENDRKLFDVKIAEIKYVLNGKTYVLDLGITHNEYDNEAHTDFNYKSRVADQGDLSTFYGYTTIDAKNSRAEKGIVYSEVLDNIDSLKYLKYKELHKKGVLYVRVKNLPENLYFTNYPVQIISESYVVPDLELKPGVTPTFLITKQGEITHVVVNGFVQSLSANSNTIKNGLLLK